MSPNKIVLCGALLLLLAAGAAAYAYEQDVDADEGEDEGEAEMMRSPPYSPHHTMPMPARRPWIHRPRAPLTTHNLTVAFMRALETKNALLLMMLVDQKTEIFYETDLPAGGLYKGRRGLLELGEACIKMVRVTNSSHKIINVDEERNTATVIRSFTGVGRRSGNAFSARTMFVIKFALHRVACIDIIDLDYETVKAALSTRAEKALCALGEEWFVHGPTAPQVMARVADNITVVFGAGYPKTLFKVEGKSNVAKHIRDQEKTDACKLLECLKNHTDESLVLHADDNRVVMINFAGNILQNRKLLDRFSEGTILHGVSRFGDGDKKYGMAVYFTMHEFDNDGKLTRVYVQLTRPLTLLDRVHLRNVHNITINVDHVDH